MTSKYPLSTFHAACAAHIMGHETGIKLKGTPERVKIFEEVLGASKDLYQALNESDIGMSTVRKKLYRKRVASKKFHTCFGRPWVL